MGIDWEWLLDAEDEDLQDAYEDLIDESIDNEVYPDEDAGDDPYYAHGTLNGEPAAVIRCWSHHTFTDEEIEKLFAGEEIEIGYEDRTGKARRTKGRLERCEYEGRTVTKFVPHFEKRKAAELYHKGSFQGAEAAVKKVWGGHVFTDEELQKLFAGESVTVEYTVKKSGEKRTAAGRLVPCGNDGALVRFKPDFED